MKEFLKRFFDYDIVGEYFDSGSNGHLYKKYIRKYRLRGKKA